MNRNWFLIVAGLLLGGTAGSAFSQTPSNPSADKSKAATLDTDPHLVGWWKFEEASGKTAADSSGKGHDGTLDGNLAAETNHVPGRVGQAIQFDGKDGVRVVGFKGVTGMQARTAAVWMKTSVIGGDLLTWGQNEPGRMFHFGFVRGRIGLEPRGGYYYMKADTHDGKWHHVAVTVQAASPPNLHDHVKLYKDGEIAEIDDIGLLDLWPLDTGDQQDLSIGRRFKGLLDDVRLYDRTLSDEEIKALFKLETNRPVTQP